jgi:hypothetical protein
MSTPKSFGVKSNQSKALESFLLHDDRERVVSEPFRIMPKLRLDVVQMMVSAVTLDGTGGRSYNLDILAYVIRESLCAEVYNDQAERWERVDDRRRFTDVLASDRWDIPIETLGEIAMWIGELVSGGHPTGAPKPSSDGRTTLDSGSTGSASSVASTSQL